MSLDFDKRNNGLVAVSLDGIGESSGIKIGLGSHDLDLSFMLYV